MNFKIICLAAALYLVMTSALPAINLDPGRVAMFILCWILSDKAFKG